MNSRNETSIWISGVGAIGFSHLNPFAKLCGGKKLLQTRISQIEILQWKRGTNQAEPIVHKVAAKVGEGWGNHLGFEEMEAGIANHVWSLEEIVGLLN